MKSAIEQWNELNEKYEDLDRLIENVSKILERGADTGVFLRGREPREDDVQNQHADLAAACKEARPELARALALAIEIIDLEDPEVE